MLRLKGGICFSHVYRKVEAEAEKRFTGRLYTTFRPRDDKELKNERKRLDSAGVKQGSFSNQSQHLSNDSNRPQSRSRGMTKDPLFSSTLQLPKTKFEFNAPGTSNELLFRNRTTQKLYRWQTKQHDRPSFVLHDGPPYANGNLHLGHIINKVLKDIINRYQLMQGRRVHYLPGWDCHGLPIEQKVATTFKGLAPFAVPPLDMRAKAKQLSLDSLETQKKEFKLLGLMTGWETEETYRTIDPKYEERQFKIFGEMVRRGLVYRAKRPCYWSPSSYTALAESEIEHNKNHFSRTLYVRYPMRPGPSLIEVIRKKSSADDLLDKIVKGQIDIQAVIWTTTGWSLPANMAITVNPELSYSLVVPDTEICNSKVFLVATDRIEIFEKIKLGRRTRNSGGTNSIMVGPVREILKFPGSALLDSKYRQPFLSKKAKSRPVLAASYVTADAGTGVVHCAPAHGLDDYHTWQAYQLKNKTTAAAKEDLINPIDKEGQYTKQVDEMLLNKPLVNVPADVSFAGLYALGKGGRDIFELLYQDGWILGDWPMQHSYPYDWRTKLPVITRATSQWFVDLEKIKEAALKALDHVKFVPESGRPRLEAFIRLRNEWCISRQRSWGLPIPVLYNAVTNEPLLTVENIEHIATILAKKGTDYWWQGDAEEFVIPQEKKEGVQWVKGLDTLDVWFDSGTSWSQLPGVEEEITKSGKSHFSAPSKPVANVYLEGSDQHRGWFQSSLLSFIATSSSMDHPRAPYETVITHGFLVDKKGKKMSKSEGNVISPMLFLLGGPKQKQIAYAADSVRWWTAKTDYTSDITVSAIVVKRADDELRKVRNTFRFLLSYVPLPQEVPSFDSIELDFTEQYMISILTTLEKDCKEAYDNFDFAKVVRKIAEFANTTVSAFYITNIKDIIYSDAKDNKRRQAVIVVLDQIFKTLLSAIAPIAPHLAEEVWYFYNGAIRLPESQKEPGDSYFQTRWHQVAPFTIDAERVEEDMKVIFELKDSIWSELEVLRQTKVIKSSFGAQVKLLLPKRPKESKILQSRKEDLARIFGVSYCDLVDELPSRDLVNPLEAWPRISQCSSSGVGIAIEPSRNQTCPRCRKSVRQEQEDLCGRCAEVMEMHYPNVR